MITYPGENSAADLRNQTDLGLCSVGECTAPVKCRGMCSKHYQRMRNTGTTNPRPPSTPPICSLCEDPAIARGWCARHYSRWQLNGDPGRAERLYRAAPVECAVSGCGRTATTKDLCAPHYERQKRNGDPGPAEILIPTWDRPPSECAVDGCDRDAYARGWCGSHYHRWQRDGEPGPAEIKEYGTDDIQYAAAHVRACRAKGRAREHSCVHCGEPASDWAYDHKDPAPKISKDKGLKYSTDPDHYQPMCRPCHKKFDVDHGREELSDGWGVSR